MDSGAMLRVQLGNSGRFAVACLPAVETTVMTCQACRSKKICICRDVRFARVCVSSSIKLWLALNVRNAVVRVLVLVEIKVLSERVTGERLAPTHKDILAYLACLFEG